MLKLGCLPYDKVDFSRVMNALLTRGFIVIYRVGDCDYGWIPSWNRHQIINNRESASVLPEPPINAIDSTRDSREGDAWPTRLEHAQGEGKGKEGKGKEAEGTSSTRGARATPPPEDFPIVDAMKKWAEVNVPGVDIEKETPMFLDHHKKKGDRFVDWVAAWRFWMRKALEYGHVNGNGHKPPVKPKLKDGLPEGYEWQYDEAGKRVGAIKHVKAETA
jgi:hypothetical protein